MIKVGVIGAGFIGPAHVEAVRRLGGVEVIALAASSQASTEKKARALSIPRAYGDWRDLVRDPEVQVVHNCTPNRMHREVNLAALSAGKHVVAEKPLGLSSQETADQVRALQATSLVGAVCFNYRMYPLVQEARVRAAGELGKIRLIHGCYLQDWLLYETDYNWRVDVEQAGASRAIADIGSHWCDLAEFVSGRRIVAVCADLATFMSRRLRPDGEIETFSSSTQQAAANTREIVVETEDYGSVLLHFDDGVRGSCTISQVSAGHKNGLRFEVDGSAGSLAWEQECPNELWLGRRDGSNALLLTDPSLLSETARRFAHYPGGHGEGYPDGFKNLMARIYAFIQEGRDPRTEPADFPTFEDGHRSALVIDAILESHRRQGWVPVSG